jgi:UDPglucose 6-dehydrogenase
MAAVLAAAGFKVIGIDRDPDTVAAVGAGTPPVDEPGLAELMSEVSGSLTATSSWEVAMTGSDVSFVVVPTPSDESGLFSIRHVLDAVTSIGDALRSTSREHLVVITSTVMPGATRGPIAAALQAAAGRHVGICYSPEFIALGSVIHDLRNPDVILIGQDRPADGDRLEAVIRRFAGSSPPVARLSHESAEVAKLAVNTFVTTKIAYANMLADICGRLPGADVDGVLAAVGEDTRVGRKYLRAATPFGGPCFPRDNRALAALAESLGARADIARATQSLNTWHLELLVDEVRRECAPGQLVAVLGLAYKAGSTVVDESPGIKLASRLFDLGYAVSAHDAAAAGPARRKLPEAVRVRESVRDALAGAAVVVVCTPDPAYARIVDRKQLPAGLVIIDCWGMIGSTTVARVVRPGRAELPATAVR